MIYYSKNSISVNTFGKTIGPWLSVLPNKYFMIRIYDHDVVIQDIYYDFFDQKTLSNDFNLRLETVDLDIDSYIAKNIDMYNFVINIIDMPGKSCSDDESVEIYAGINQIYKNDVLKMLWAITRKKNMESGKYDNDVDFLKYHLIQNELKDKIVKFASKPFEYLSCEYKYIAGCDVAYNDEKKQMVAAIVVLDILTLDVVESSTHFMEVTFPYIPGLFSFREIPPIVEAFKKLKIKPDLIICDGHGIAHPNGIGMASHLGIELDIPTIGCAKTRLVGAFDKANLDKTRGSYQYLTFADEIVGVALRTQDDVKPVFVSMGHKIDLQSSIKWVLKMSPNYRLPETTRFADQIVNKMLKDRFEYDLFEDGD